MRSERRLGERDLSEAYYALDGQFVSNWRDLKSTAVMSIVFPRSDSELIPQGLLVPHYITLVCMPIAILLFVVALIKIFGNMNSKHRVFGSLFDFKKQILPFVCGFFICFASFELAVIVAELSSWNMFNPNSVIVKHCILVIICGVVFVPCLGILPCIPCVKPPLSKAFDPKDYPDLKKAFFGAILILALVILSLLFSAWLIISLLATILLGIAYPFHTLSLFMVHVAFMFVVTVSLAVVISGPISVLHNKSDEVQKESDEVQKKKEWKKRVVECVIARIVFLYYALSFSFCFIVLCM